MFTAEVNGPPSLPCSQPVRMEQRLCLLASHWLGETMRSAICFFSSIIRYGGNYVPQWTVTPMVTAASFKKPEISAFPSVLFRATSSGYCDIFGGFPNPNLCVWIVINKRSLNYYNFTVSSVSVGDLVPALMNILL